MNEQYEELVFSEPVQAFYERVADAAPAPAQPVPAIAPHFRAFEPGEDLGRIGAARQRIAQMNINLQRQLNNLA
jgi:YEATS domain-containing protein 4